MAGIVIVDYGMANLRSVQKAIERIGSQAEISGDPHTIASADKVILPGVGAFRDAIARLRETGLVDPIVEHIEEGNPFLGICLGLQLLFTRGHEDGLHAGLDVVPGEVVRFPQIPGLKVPHMGWNELQFNPQCPLFKGLDDRSSVYFVHSYYARPVESGVTSATACYPEPFTAAIWRDNLFATQFHPEKSQKVGLQILKNFADL